MRSMEKQPDNIKKKGDYRPSPGEYMLEQMTHDPAALRDMLQKIQEGVYESSFICDESGKVIEEKVTDKNGKFVWYNDARETGKAVIAPHVKHN